MPRRRKKPTTRAGTDLVPMGERIREARRNKGLTQIQLAHMLGMNYDRSVISWEKGESLPSRHVRELAEALDVSIPWIWHGEEEPRRDGYAQILEILRSIETKVDRLSK